MKRTQGLTITDLPLFFRDIIMRNVIQNHLQGKPVKDYKLSIQTSEQKLSQMAQVVVDFIVNQSAKNLQVLRETQSYWESFFSDWVADIEMKKAILECIKTGSRSSLCVHIHYILQLSENSCAEPKDKSAPQKKKDFKYSFLDELRNSGKPYFGFH